MVTKFQCSYTTDNNQQSKCNVIRRKFSCGHNGSGRFLYFLLVVGYWVGCEDEVGNTSGGYGDDGCCYEIWMVVNGRRGGGERIYMPVMELDEADRSHAEILVVEGLL